MHGNISSAICIWNIFCLSYKYPWNEKHFIINQVCHQKCRWQLLWNLSDSSHVFVQNWVFALWLQDSSCDVCAGADRALLVWLEPFDTSWTSLLLREENIQTPTLRSLLAPTSTDLKTHTEICMTAKLERRKSWHFQAKFVLFLLKCLVYIG